MSVHRWSFRFRADQVAPVILFAGAVMMFGPGCGGPTVESAESVRSSAFADSIDGIVEDAIRTLGHAPAIAVGVVEDGAVTYLNTFVDETTDQRPVGTDTGFYVAAATKTYTALLTQMLVDDGVLDLDERVSDYLSGPTLPESVGRITIRDLLGQAAGVDNLPMSFRVADSGRYTRELLVELLAKSVDRQGRAFAEGNFEYVLLSMIIEEATDRSWKDLLQERVLSPAGLENTTARLADRPEMATPFIGTGGGSRAIDLFKTEETMHAGGGVVSTLADLTRWVSLFAARGVLEGNQVVPEQLIDESQEPVVELDQQFYMFQHNGYGLGWFIGEYAGEKLLHSIGTFAGWRTHISFMPEREAGVVVLTNEMPLSMFDTELIAAYVYDQVLGIEDPHVAFRERMEEVRQQGERTNGMLDAMRLRTIGAERDPGRAREAYVGHYRSDLGDLRFSVQGDSLLAQIGWLRSAAGSVDGRDGFFLEFLPGRALVAEFHFGADAEVDSVSYEGASFLPVPQ